MRCALVALAAVLAAGCGDNIRGLPFDQLDAARRTAQCERLVRCGVFADQATCEAFFRPHPDLELADALAAGKVRYDEIAAQHCVDALAMSSCSASARDVRVLPAACTKMLSGTIADGAACAFNGECVSGACELPTCPRNMCCAGTCRATKVDAPLDAACDTAANCVANAFCGKDHACHALATIGAPCDDDSQCDYGLGCIGAGIDPGACRPLPLTGESCPYQRCAELGARCDSTSTCIAVGLPGAPCSTNEECTSFGSCDTATQHCIAAPTIGMPCSRPCAGAAFCDFKALPAPTCIAPAANNQPCGADNECASFYCEEGPMFDFCTDGPRCF